MDREWYNLDLIMKALGGFGKVLIGLAVAAAIVTAIILIFKYGGDALQIILPIIYQLAGTLTLLNILLLLVVIIPKARGVAGYIILVSSLVYGLWAWIFGLIVTLSIWGWIGVIIGVLMGGVGVVPLALLASIVDGKWDLFWPLIINIGVYFAALTIGTLLIESAEKHQANSENDQDIIDIEPIDSTPADSEQRSWKDLE